MRWLGKGGLEEKVETSGYDFGCAIYVPVRHFIFCNFSAGHGLEGRRSTGTQQTLGIHNGLGNIRGTGFTGRLHREVLACVGYTGTGLGKWYVGAVMSYGS